MVNKKLNANVGEGRELSERYNVNGVPQMIFVRNDGLEIDRIVGYLNPEDYISRVEDILAGKNTLIDLEQRYETDKDDLDLLLALGEKYENKGDFDRTTEVYGSILKSHSDNTTEEVNRARYFLAMQEFFDGDRRAIDQFLFKYSFSSYVKDAYQQMSRYYASQQDTTNEVAVLITMCEKYPDDPGALNSYAWRMTELNQNLEDALVKAAHAVGLEDDPLSRAQILDTKAEIQWKLNRIDEALKTIDEAIKDDPDNEYLKNQKTKFTG